MATCDLPTPKVGLLSSVVLNVLNNFVLHYLEFDHALQATTSTAAAARLAAAHGIPVMPEALWRHRGTLVSGGLPTWRG